MSGFKCQPSELIDIQTLAGGDKPRPYRDQAHLESSGGVYPRPVLEADESNIGRDLSHHKEIKESFMGIMVRAIRIFKADVHGVMDQLEDKGLLLKQNLRDMAEALNLKEVKLNMLLAARKQAQQQYDKYQQQSKVLEQDLAVAIQKNKDDIARMLIRKIKPMENLHDEIAERIRDLDEEYSDGRDRLDQQRLRYDRLKHRSINFSRKTPIQELQRIPAEFDHADNYGEISEAEIELELLKRKEALGAVQV